MAVNVGRGLMRLAAVVSVVWVVGAATGAYFVLRDDIEALTGERPGAQKVLKCDESTDPALRPLCDFQDRVRESILKLDEPRFAERRKQAWSNVALGGLFVIGPPVLLFLIAAAGSWVIRGFR